MMSSWAYFSVLSCAWRVGVFWQERAGLAASGRLLAVAQFWYLQLGGVWQIGVSKWRVFDKLFYVGVFVHINRTLEWGHLAQLKITKNFLFLQPLSSHISVHQ